MLFSKNCFFKQNKAYLKVKRIDIYNLLLIKEYTSIQSKIYLKAYDYFTDSPNEFDGATIVKDLNDIPELDLDAMLHDYHYLKYNVASSLKYKILADWLYTKQQEKKGKGLYSSISRLILLSIFGFFITLFSLIKRGKITDEQKKEFLEEYNILMKRL
jgi:hypothetical protein